MDLAIDSCIRDDIMADFLKKNRNEVSGLGIFEYNFDEHMRMEKEESYEQGQIAKLSQVIKGLTETMG